MNKNDLIAAVADSSGLTKADAGRAVDAVFSSIEGALKGGGEVRIAVLVLSQWPIVQQQLAATHVPARPFKSLLPNSRNSRLAHRSRTL